MTLVSVEALLVVSPTPEVPSMEKEELGLAIDKPTTPPVLTTLPKTAIVPPVPIPALI